MKREISSFIQKELEFNNALVTVSGVIITDDLREGKVFISALGGNLSSILDKLTKNKAAIQRHINKRTNLRCTPVLMFRPDTSAERGVELVNLLDEVAKLPTAPEENEES